MTFRNVKALLSVQPNFCTAFVILHLFQAISSPCNQFIYTLFNYILSYCILFEAFPHSCYVYLVLIILNHVSPLRLSSIDFKHL